MRFFVAFLAFFCIFFAIFAGFFCVSFKTDNKNLVEIEAKNSNLEPSLLFAVIKAESRFDQNAKSKKGAIGLMQVMPQTANYVLGLNGESLVSEQDLFLPQNNIKIGAMYLSYLIQKFNNLSVSICAYNAGETVVFEWLQNPNYSSDGKTLKKIPYSETERYLKKVQFNQFVYSKILRV